MKKLIALLLWLVTSVSLAQTFPIQNLQVLGTAAFTGVATFTIPVGVGSGGTGGNVASGTLLDNITGFSSTGYIKRTGAGTYAFALPIPVSDGGTNATSASGTALDNITGFAGTGFLTRTGAGTYAFQSATNGVTLGNLAQIGANTVLANPTGSTANVQAFTMPSCSGSSNAVSYTTNTGFGCNSTINATFLSGNTWTSPGTIGSVTPQGGAFTNLSATTGASIANGLTVTSGGASITGGLFLPSGTRPKGDDTNYAATTAFTANGRPCANIMDYGGDNTGSLNNDTAFTNAVASTVNTGNVKCVEFPPGQFNFASQAVVSLASAYQSITIKGAGADVTDLYWPSNQGLEVAFSSGTDTAHVQGLSLLAGSNNAGVGLQFDGTFTSTSSAGMNTIEDVTIRDVNGYFGANNFAIGIYIDRVCGVNFNNIQAIGYSTTLRGVGIEITTTSLGAVPIVYNLSNSSINFYNDGLILGPEVQGVQMVNMNFTGDVNGVLVPGSESGLDQLSIVNSQFNAASGSANIDIGSAVPNLTISNNLFLINNSSYGIYLNTTSTTTITGNSFEPNTGSPSSVTGIYINGYTNGAGVITGNTFYNVDTGIGLSATSHNFDINSNAYNANVTNVSNGGCTGCVIGTATP